MDNQVKIVIAKDSAIGITDVGVITFESSADTGPNTMPLWSTPAQKTPLRVQRYEIIPYGDNNLYPDMIEQTLENNHLAARVIERHAELLWGSGPMLFHTRFVNGKRVKSWHNDKDIQKWLDSWDYISYLQKVALEFHTYRICFTKVFRSHHGLTRIEKLEPVAVKNARFEWPADDKIIRHVIISDTWENTPGLSLKGYPVSDNSDADQSIAFSMQSSFALENEYPRSSIHGTINWIRTSSMVPVILAAENLNAAAIKYHVRVPALYWEKHKDRLQAECIEKGTPYKDKMLEDLKDETFSKITVTLAGIENAGKMITSDELYDATGGQYVGWRIEVLDQKVKDFIDAQIGIAKHSDYEVTAGLGMHPALSNVSEIIGLSKGSELLYTHKLYQLTGVDIPEQIVMKEINRAIRVNFPDSDFQLGFNRDQ